LSRIALYRKYRSNDFSNVVGQQHVTRTLEAAVERGLVSHAYLLTGPHGTGKTSIARILARRVNDLPVDTELERELDIIEIDAASNRGIDEIRDLREKITSAPTSLRYKVYIIDEVHMLTREAFNALLKTLEEPPAHAIFILATTEAHKLPETIISRTQRFDLRPITEADLTARLQEIAKSEGISIDPQATQLIARASRGGFRDAIGLLDQLSVLGESLTVQHVAAVLGMVEESAIQNLIAAILARDVATTLNGLEELVVSGSDPQSVTYQLLDSMRQMLLGKSGESAGQDQAAWIIECLTKALADFKVTNHYSLPLELALYRAATGPQRSATPPVQDVSAETATSSASEKKTAESVSRVKEQQKANPSLQADDEALCLKALSLIKERNNSLFAVMKSAQPRIEGNELRLDCRFRFHKERIEEQRNRQLIEQTMSKVLGRDIVLNCKLSESQQKEKVPDPNEELVASALEILGGEVVSG